MIKIENVLKKDYFTKADIDNTISDKDPDFEQKRFEAYSLASNRLCEKVDLYNEAKLCFSENDGWSDRVLKLTCLRSINSGDIIYMFENKAIFILRKIGNKYSIVGRKEGKIKRLDNFKSYKIATVWCICKMLMMTYGF